MACNWRRSRLLLASLHGVVTQGKRPFDSLNLLLCVTLVAAPNAWGYHYAMIFPAIFAALARELAAPSLWRLPLVLGCWVALVIPAWSDLPHPLAGIAWLNVAFHGRYALVALVLAGAILAEMVAAHGKRRPLAEPPLHVSLQA
jgi:hypothetical protein